MDINRSGDIAAIKLGKGQSAAKKAPGQLARLAKMNNLNEAEAAKFNRELKTASDGFEELFVHKMLQTMRSNTMKSEFISGGRGEEVFQDMLDENYAKIITKTEALGLSKVIYEHTKK